MLAAARTDLSSYGSDVQHRDMITRRQQHLGGSLLFYNDPLHVVRGEGVWLYDDQGNRYLDCYNNVASVGHCNTNVVAALTAQANLLNTHTRYLSEKVIEYAEDLTSLMPDGLDVCFFVCTGTEANELAMRMAREFTGNRGTIVMENSYHGNSTLIHELSTALSGGELPPYVATVEAPNAYRGSFINSGADNAGIWYSGMIDAAVEQLKSRDERLAAFLCDTIFDTQGSLVAPKDYFRRVYEEVRSAGGLCIADEVQAGLCRTGRWWGFEHYDVVPDIVTLGKPMGDGHPVAAVVTSREIAERFTTSTVYFNTFGGNPVSAAVGDAVLNICREQDLARHCADTGNYLKEQLEELADRQPLIGHIHGHGLFLGVELVHDRVTLEPAADIARRVPDAMKAKGVVMGMTGPLGNILKIRPPLVFSRDNADQLVVALEEVLQEHA
jgi:4-aminobutyrate aminotransferase-like enzyme